MSIENIDTDRLTKYFSESGPLISALNEVIGKYVSNADKTVKPVMIDGKLVTFVDSYKAFPTLSK